MSAVWFLLGADARVLSSADWQQIGAGTGLPDTRWDYLNGWSIDSGQFNAAQLSYLAAHPFEWNVNGPTGSVRPGGQGGGEVEIIQTVLSEASIVATGITASDIGGVDMDSINQILSQNSGAIDALAASIGLTVINEITDHLVDNDLLRVSNGSGTITVPLTPTFDSADRLVTPGYRNVNVIAATGASAINFVFTNPPTDGSAVNVRLRVLTASTSTVVAISVNGVAAPVQPNAVHQNWFARLFSFDGTVAMLFEAPPTLADNGSNGNPPGVPLTPGATAGDAQVTVTWSAVATATGYSVLNVNTGASVDVGNVSTYTVRPLTNGTIYTFKVRATNANGSSADSSPSLGVTPQSSASGDPNHLVQYSLTTARETPQFLDGASGLSGIIYVQIILANGVTVRTAASGGSGIQFNVDGANANLEFTAPWDLNGASVANVPNGLDLTVLGNGPHTVGAVCDTTAGIQIVTASFTVANQLGSMSGDVKSAGSAVAGASVMASTVDQDTSHAFFATSDAGGLWSIPSLPVGTYKIWATKTGYLAAASVTAVVTLNTPTPNVHPTVTVQTVSDYPTPVPSYGPNGTKSPGQAAGKVAVPWVKTTPNVVVSADPTAIKNAIVAAQSAAASGTKYVIGVQDGTIDGNAFKTICKSLLGPSGNLGASRGMSILVKPVNGYGAVTFNNGLYVTDVQGVVFANMKVNGILYMDATNSGFWRISCTACKSQRSNETSWTEIYAEPYPAIREDDGVDWWSWVGDQNDNEYYGVYVGPSYNPSTSSKHIDAIQFEPNGGFVTNRPYLKDVLTVGRIETNACYGDMNIDHCAVIAHNQLISVYPTPSGAKIYDGTSAFNGGSANQRMVFKNSKIIGGITYTSTPLHGYSVTNTTLNGWSSIIQGFTATTETGLTVWNNNGGKPKPSVIWA